MKSAFATLLIATTATASLAQNPPPPPVQPPVTARPYSVGNPLGFPVTVAADGAFKPMSANVKVYGAIYSAESCTYDPDRGVIVVPNRGVAPNLRANDAWITLMNHDGSIHTSRWIGVQNAGAERDAMTPPLMLNEPYGSDIMNGVLYLADRNETGVGTPPLTVIRRFDLKTGKPLDDIRVPDASFFNDIAVAQDGTVYGTVTGSEQVWRVLPNGQASIFAQGAPISRPNGVAIDKQGNVVVVNMGTTAILTYSREGTVIRTENAAQAGNDGLVIMDDGTKYVSSVQFGGVSRIRPGQQAELIAENIPSAASMCYDSGANQLVIPMNANNALAFIKLQ